MALEAFKPDAILQDSIFSPFKSWDDLWHANNQQKSGTRISEVGFFCFLCLVLSFPLPRTPPGLSSASQQAARLGPSFFLHSWGDACRQQLPLKSDHILPLPKKCENLQLFPSTGNPVKSNRTALSVPRPIGEGHSLPLIDWQWESAGHSSLSYHVSKAWIRSENPDVLT